jgi:hypothetical protein
MKVYVMIRSMHDEKLAEVAVDAFSTLDAAKVSILADYDDKMIGKFEWQEELDFSKTNPEDYPRIWIGDPDNGLLFVIREVEVS